MFKGRKEWSPRGGEVVVDAQLVEIDEINPNACHAEMCACDLCKHDRAVASIDPEITRELHDVIHRLSRAGVNGVESEVSTEGLGAVMRYQEAYEVAATQQGLEIVR
jgi:hypothetical protein